MDSHTLKLLGEANRKCNEISMLRMVQDQVQKIFYRVVKFPDAVYSNQAKNGSISVY